MRLKYCVRAVELGYACGAHYYRKLPFCACYWILIWLIRTASLVSGNEESAREGQNVAKKFHMGYPVGKTGAAYGQRPDEVSLD